MRPPSWRTLQQLRLERSLLRVKRRVLAAAALCALWAVRGVGLARRHPRGSYVAMATFLVAGSLAAFLPPITSHNSRAYAAGARANGVTGMARLADLFGAHRHVHFKTATTVPNPAPPSVANAAPMQSHEVFGFAPYWNLNQSSSFDVADLTTLAYFDLTVNPDGSLLQSGPGWNGFESQDFTNLVNRAHAAGDRVVLSVGDFDQGSLNQLVSNSAAAQRLANAVLTDVEAKNLDGVNLDLEGQGAGDQAGLTALVQKVATTLHAANPHYQVTMDTYAGAAADPGSFYDIKSLAPWVDGFFVMEYQYNLQSGVSPQSPITSSEYSDLQTLEQYTATVPASKVIMGVPYYGLDWATTDGTQQATSTDPSPTPKTLADIASEGHPVYWDPVTDTPWTSYKAGNQWHEIYYEDPSSVYMETQLAERFGVAGMGIWALGMDSTDPALMAAILGNAPAQKDTLAGPTSTLPRATTGGASALPQSSLPTAELPAPTSGFGATPTTGVPGTTTTTGVPATTTTGVPATTTTGAPGTTAGVPGTSTTEACTAQAPAAGSWPSGAVAVGCWAEPKGAVPTPEGTYLYAVEPPAGGTTTPPATAKKAFSWLVGINLAPTDAQSFDPVLACLAKYTATKPASPLVLPVVVTTNTNPKDFYVSVSELLAINPALANSEACAPLKAVPPPVEWLQLATMPPVSSQAPGSTTTGPPVTTSG